MDNNCQTESGQSENESQGCSRSASKNPNLIHQDRTETRKDQKNQFYIEDVESVDMIDDYGQSDYNVIDIECESFEINSDLD
jgi:hypothetical protein